MKKNIEKTMSKFAKLFWGTILLFIIVYITLILLSSLNSKPKKEQNNTIVLKNIVKEIELIVHSNKIKQNIENNITKKAIKKSLQKNINMLTQSIDSEINFAFLSVENNIDNFLDFHYSVLGEYIELGAMASGNVAKTIEEKLFPKEFNTRTQKALESINSQYKLRVSEHFSLIDKELTKDVNLELNSKIIEDLQKNITNNMKIQSGKLASLVTIAIVPTIAKVISIKIATISSSKIALKLSAKLTSKSVAATTGLASGAICGPAFWICSPIAAATLWFGTDAIVNSINEIYNREEFKQDIMKALNKKQEELKKELKTSYTKSFKILSSKMLEQYNSSEIKEIKRVKVREKIGI